MRVEERSKSAPRRRGAGREHPRIAFRRLLEARRGEVEQAILTRVYGITDPSKVPDPAYVPGLRAAVSAAVEWGLAAVGPGDEFATPVPMAILAQARMAARGGVDLSTVQRRYHAGHALMADFVVDEAERCGPLSPGMLREVLRAQAVLVDRLAEVVTEEYNREVESTRPTSLEARRADQVKRLLAGDPIDTSSLEYDFDAHHVGLVASGPGVVALVSEMAGALDCRALSIRKGETTVWAWFGARRPLDRDHLHAVARKAMPDVLSLSFGEPGKGLDDWRFTHQQARATHPLATKRQGEPVRYGDSPLLVAAVQSELLATSLRRHYLAPLDGGRGGGEPLRATLWAYFACNRQIRATAAALGVNRNTVANRIGAIEERLGRSVPSCAAELEVALRLEELNCLPGPRPS